MKIIYTAFTMQKGVPTISPQEIKLKKGWSLSVVEDGSVSDDAIPPIKITKISWRRIALEVKSDNYRKFETKKDKS